MTLKMKNSKLALVVLLGLSFSSAAFATSSAEKVANMKEVASDIALSRKHFKAVNETDPKKRKALFEEVYDPNVHFAGPRGAVDGRAELEKLFAEIHKKPGVVFQDIGEIEAHHGIARIHWALINSGVSGELTGDDFIRIKDGKVTEVYIIVNGWTKSVLNNSQEK